MNLATHKLNWIYFNSRPLNLSPNFYLPASPLKPAYFPLNPLLKLLSGLKSTNKALSEDIAIPDP